MVWWSHAHSSVRDLKTVVLEPRTNKVTRLCCIMVPADSAPNCINVGQPAPDKKRKLHFNSALNQFFTKRNRFLCSRYEPRERHNMLTVGMYEGRETNSLNKKKKPNVAFLWDQNVGSTWIHLRPVKHWLPALSGCTGSMWLGELISSLSVHLEFQSFVLDFCLHNLRIVFNVWTVGTLLLKK